MENKYGIIEPEKPEFPIRNLLIVPHKEGDLTLGYPAFGSNYFSNNVGEMKKDYSHPETGETMTFRPATTSESISAAAYDFENTAKPKIFDLKCLHMGYIIKTQEGVFANPPRNSQGHLTFDKETLKGYLKSDKKVNGIYLLGNDFGFAPYESFTSGVQDCDTFARGGLARILEYTPEKVAKNLREISSPRFYKRGVKVFGVHKSESPALRLACLSSGRGFGSGRLNLGGLIWVGNNYGYAFGVL